MTISSNNRNDKSQVQINIIYNQQGEAFEDILKNSIKNLIQSGKIYKNMLKLNKQIVIKNGAKEEEI